MTMTYQQHTVSGSIKTKWLWRIGQRIRLPSKQSNKTCLVFLDALQGLKRRLVLQECELVLN